MRAACFPFTSMDVGLLKLLTACFETIDLYLPSASGAPDDAYRDNLVLHVPENDTDRQVETIYQACVQWREATRGAAPSFFKTGQAPFFDEAGASFLRREIVNNHLTDTDGSPALLLQALIFLRLAADHDNRQIEVDRSLGLLNQREKALFTSLQGNEEVDGTVGPTGAATLSNRSDRGSLMTSDRLTAWSTLALAMGVASDVLVTDSRAVVDYLHDTLPGGHMPVDQMAVSIPDSDLDPTAQWQPAWNRFWHACLRNNAEQAPAPPVFSSLSDNREKTEISLTVLTYPDTDLPGFLTALAGRDDIRPSHDRQPSMTGTLIACFKPL